MFKFEITESSAVEAFNRLIALGEDPSGLLMSIGEASTAFTKRRFELSADPYGEPWQPNSDTTLRAALHRKENTSGGIFNKRNGKLNKPGLQYLAGKKPLIGESKTLSHEINPTVIGNDSVIVTPVAKYAAMQHFGGTKAQFPHLWGDIPARPIFPDESRGLPDELQQDISEVLRSALVQSWSG